MAENDVGSLLVYDKKRVGADGKVPTSVEACVGIITERGEQPSNYNRLGQHHHQLQQRHLNNGLCTIC